MKPCLQQCSSLTDRGVLDLGEFSKVQERWNYVLSCEMAFGFFLPSPSKQQHPSRAFIISEQIARKALGINPVPIFSQFNALFILLLLYFSPGSKAYNDLYQVKFRISGLLRFSEIWCNLSHRNLHVFPRRETLLWFGLITSASALRLILDFYSCPPP